MLSVSEVLTDVKAQSVVRDPHSADFFLRGMDLIYSSYLSLCSSGALNSGLL